MNIIKCSNCNALLKQYKSIRFTEYDNYTYTHLGHKWELLRV
jgi:hypothetical protein